MMPALIAALCYAASDKRNGICGFITVTDQETALLVSTVISLSNFLYQKHEFLLGVVNRSYS